MSAKILQTCSKSPGCLSEIGAEKDKKYILEKIDQAGQGACDDEGARSENMMLSFQLWPVRTRARTRALEGLKM